MVRIRRKDKERRPVRVLATEIHAWRGWRPERGSDLVSAWLTVGWVTFWLLDKTFFNDVIAVFRAGGKAMGR